MAIPVLENANDYSLAKQLDCTVDSIREERTAAYASLQKQMQARGVQVPDDLAEFMQWVLKTLRSQDHAP